MAAYLITIFLSSFLLFQVQPLIGRYILPWFGGSPAVWTTCMLFFQVMLLAGYGYAHYLTGLAAKKQRLLHLFLLAASLAFLPIAPSAAYWKSSSEGSPLGAILLLLTVNIGAPYLILSSTAPLVQHWFARSFPERSPYRLYALSNSASLLALVSYPFLVEPTLTLSRQVGLWSWGFLLFAASCTWCTLLSTREEGSGEDITSWQRPHPDPLPEGEREADVPPPATQESPPGSGLTLLWLMLSACGSAALLATTNQVCQEVAVVPFLWVAPLTLYLVTFIICFNSDRGYQRGAFATMFFISLLPACWLLYAKKSASLPIELLVFLELLFACCMVCHGELVRLRPGPRYLTRFYLTMSVGGAVGGLFVALVAPLFFKGYWELPIVLTASSLALALTWYREGGRRPRNRRALAGVALATLSLAGFTIFYIAKSDGGALASSRNFYGVLRVVPSWDSRGSLLYLVNGRVLHGFQYQDPQLKKLATTYYAPESGVGLALRFHPRRTAADPERRALHIGVVGLGTGTLAAYGQKGDSFRFYEINNDVIDFADRYFSFRRDSAARVETVPGDARIQMEAELKRQQPQKFDVLVVDAFTSDSIPVHLLTRECVSIYRQHLNPDGLLLIHVTNHFLDLVPVVEAQARTFGYRTATISSKRQQVGESDCLWMVVTNNEAFLKREEIRSRSIEHETGSRQVTGWTDDFVSLWQIVKW
ncbi:hypothetical protein GMLC_31710 [Geomonas limicola]|uniref:PABS domain-containing protein n=1 Tax=Geomonas limicola TaxID=2740186 RepID=A0A6V8NAF6_9BACT|nr:fused MFS/spermidine synthase [Geomonas limicola]GFO69592.1 hypothetical protein GMLC_31710 [Geomonas limicola]